MTDSPAPLVPSDAVRAVDQPPAPQQQEQPTAPSLPSREDKSVQTDLSIHKSNRDHIANLEKLPVEESEY